MIMCFATKQLVSTKIVACLGDSLTAFIESSIPEISDASNWTVLISKQLSVKTINAGVSGNTSTQLLARIQTDVIDKKPDFCIIEESVNDTFNGIATSVTIANVITMINLCKQNNIVPLVMPSPPQFNCAKFYQAHNITPIVNWEDADKLPTIRAGLKSYCSQNNVSYIDIYTPYLLTPTTQNLELYCQYDQIHPSVKGYLKTAQVVIDAIKPLLEVM